MDREMSDQPLAGRVALVTGGSRGLGAAICRRLAAHGAAVAINYKSNHAAAELVATAISAAGGRVLPAQADVSQEAAVIEMVRRVEQDLGPVEILVSNAWPGWRGGAIEDVPWESYQWYVDQIVRGTYHTVRAVLPGMKQRHWGRIITIGTTSMYELNQHHTPYIAAKGALLALTRGLARDLGPDNICVNMVSPGLIYGGDDPAPPEWGQPHAARTALGRNPSAWEVAGAVAFLSSAWADAITGVQIPVSCGLLMQAG
jgi:3-oxoacyl-[acyl-carrier protein] reductase